MIAEAFTGILVSLAVQGLKKWYIQKAFDKDMQEYITLMVVAVMSLLGAAIYAYLQKEGLWESFYYVLITAGATYTYILSRFPRA